jgi:hypothetical protein
MACPADIISLLPTARENPETVMIVEHNTGPKSWSKNAEEQAASRSWSENSRNAAASNHRGHELDALLYRRNRRRIRFLEVPANRRRGRRPRRASRGNPRGQPAHARVLQDLPSVVAGASALRRGGIADRCELVAGDFFDGVPDGGDAYLLQGIIHDWNDEAAVEILRSCRPV